MVKQMSFMNLSLSWWSTYNNETINKLVAQIKNIAKETVQTLSERDNISDEIADVCQIISNSYFPKTQTDRRTFDVSYPSHYHEWSWEDYSREWDAKSELSKMGITEEKIKKHQEIMSLRACSCDPLENWHDLVQFVSLEKKKRLKDKALLAQTLYSMEMMLRLFYKEFTGKDLSEEKGINYKWKERVYGEGVLDSNMVFLEYLTNEFHLNPRPKLILIVEGRSEYEQIPRLAKEIGYSFDSLGIRIELLEGIGNFTSGKVDRFIDHYHNLQTIVYLILDNENNAVQFKNKILKMKSRYPKSNRYLTNEDYIFIWDTCFEFDNFSDVEIANALSFLLQGFNFNEQEVSECRKSFGKQKDPISTLFKQKTGRELNKPLFSERLVDKLLAKLDQEFVDGKTQRKLIIKIMEIINLASRNYQPHSIEMWKINQESGYIGEKIE
jgi:chorismate mutase